jgi:glycosyltransferase involved in cell wall biosynthesis
MSKLLIISHDHIGERMAGVGIRYFEIACALAASHDVILAAPLGSHLPTRNASRFRGELHLYEPANPQTLAEAIQRCDVLLAYPDTVWQCRAMLDGYTPAVAVDGYDITLLEHLELDPKCNNSDEQWQWLNQYRTITRYVLSRGDLFLVGTERQRDWWLGALAANGRVNPLTYRDDPSLRRLVDLLPYGIPDQQPIHTRQVLRGVIQGITTNDKIVLWGGGAWEWLDPLTLIRAAEQIARQRSDVKFVFPGLRHPAGDLVRSMPMQQRTIELARELGLLDRVVFIGDWVAYDEWPNYLLESDLGVSLHREHLEARLSARTRVMSYVWAGLPMVLTQGDELAEHMYQAGVASLVQPGDADALAQAILSMLAQHKTSLSPKFEALRARHFWSVVVRPLKQMCDRPARAADANIQNVRMMNSTLANIPSTRNILPMDELPALQLPKPASFLGRLLRPLLDALFLWYLRAIIEQQNGINGFVLHSIKEVQQQVSSLAAHVQGLQQVSDDTRQHVFGLAAHVQGLQQVSDDTRQHVFGLAAHVQGLQQVSDDTRQHVFGLAAHVQGLQQVSDDTRQHVFGLAAHVQGLEDRTVNLQRLSDDTRQKVTMLDAQLADAESLQTEVIIALSKRLNDLS